MKLKYIEINGYGILVDESVEIKEKELYFSLLHKKVFRCINDEQYFENEFKIIFAEKELNLDVPILSNWREWEVEQLAIEEHKFNHNSINEISFRLGFIEGYNHNKAKYTKEDMIRLAIHCWNIASRPEHGAVYNVNEIAINYMKSIKKVPSYIVMESELREVNPNADRLQYLKYLKLTTNSEGKQEGVIKEIIYN